MVHMDTDWGQLATTDLLDMLADYSSALVHAKGTNIDAELRSMIAGITAELDNRNVSVINHAL